MGEGASRDAGAGGGELSALDALRRWEESGAHWRVVALGPAAASVDLLACTGERVDGLEVDDAEALAYLRERPASAAP